MSEEMSIYEDTDDKGFLQIKKKQKKQISNVMFKNRPKKLTHKKKNKAKVLYNSSEIVGYLTWAGWIVRYIGYFVFVFSKVVSGVQNTNRQLLHLIDQTLY